MCEANTQANATVGPHAVQKVLDGSVTSGEVRLPGGEFGMANDPIIEVHTSNPTLLAKAEAVVASFRLGPRRDLLRRPVQPVACHHGSNLRRRPAQRVADTMGR